MLTRVVLNTIGRIFRTIRVEPENWQAAHQEARSEIERLEKRVEDLQRALQQWVEALQKPGGLTITQATIDASAIGSTESAVGRFTKLGVGQAAPTSTSHSAYIGERSGRQYLVVDGGSSGDSAGPALVFAYNGTLTQAIGGYSSVGLGASYDQRLSIYSQSFDLVIAHTSSSYAVDFVNPANGAAAQVGTLNNAPSAGDPAYWLKIKIAGNVRYIPCWS